ncbi:MAG: acetolactate synthase [Clostridiales bacterium]|nr:acetolactate synthase [Clostridiales bacterium]
MFVKQISVFLENTKGGLLKLTRTISRHGIDLIALSIADTEQYGILRCIVSDTDLCIQALRDAGYTVRLTDVLAVSVADQPGGLTQVLALLSAADISVEYLYSFVRNSGDNALVIFRVNDSEKAARVLVDGDVKLLNQEQVRAL